MPPEHLAYKGHSKERFLAWAQRIGPATVVQVQAIFDTKAHPEQAFRTLKGIQRLVGRYDPTRVEAACARANALGLVGLRRIRNILETRLETAPLPDPAPVRGQATR